jgi:hypothetical protein
MSTSVKADEAARLRRMQKLAVECAKFAGEVEFESRRGCYPLRCKDKHHDDGTVLVIYDNHPPIAGSHYREQLYALFREQLVRHGFRELASAVWPPPQEESGGYTVVLLIDLWSKEMQKEIVDLYLVEVRRMFSEMIRASTSQN